MRGKVERRRGGSVPRVDGKDLVAGSVQHPHRLDLGRPRLRHAGSRENFQSPFLHCFQGIRSDQSPANDPASFGFRGYRLNTVNFVHSSATPRSSLAHSLGMRPWPWGKRGCRETGQFEIRFRTLLFLVLVLLPIQRGIPLSHLSLIPLSQLIFRISPSNRKSAHDKATVT
jgi:hypothetical protein